MKDHDITYALTPKDVTALARAIIHHGTEEGAARSTYLRSLLAGVQVELLGKPVLRALRKNHRAPSVEAALAAFQKVNAVYYDAVLAAIPEDVTAPERHSKTAFARSAASTLRRALSLKWSPLAALHEVSKGGLAQWIADHRAPRALTREQTERRLEKVLARARELLSGVPEREATAILRAALDGETQVLKSVSLRRVEKPPDRVSH